MSHDTPTPQSTTDAARAHQLDVLRLSAEQVKAKVAVDVMRLTDPTASRVEQKLWCLAAAHLVAYFGGEPDVVEGDDL